jgi:LysR family transcriptional regulator for bpeEF and oprC
VFYERAKAILSEVAAATSMFGSVGGAIRGRLRVDLPSVFGQAFFIEVLSEFSEIYPGIELALGITDRLVDIVAEGVDCAIRLGELADSSLIGRRVGGLKMVTCAAPDYLRTMGVPEGPEDLSAHFGVTFLSGVNRRPLPWLFSESGAEKHFRPKGRVSVNEANAYVQCGIAGFGMIQLPGVMVDTQLKNGSLVEVLSEFRPPAKPVSLLYPTRTHVAPQVNAFADWLVTRFPQLGAKWVEA